MKDKILTVPNEALREKAEKVIEIDDEVKAIIKELREAALDWERDNPYEMTAAMAAPQLGYNKKIIIIRENNESKDDISFIPLINPKVVSTGGKTKTDYEGCLSVPELFGKVERPTKATIEAKMENGDDVRIKTYDQTARVLLHEIDHLNGILSIDHIKGKKDAFYRLDKDGKLQPVDYSQTKDNKELWGE